MSKVLYVLTGIYALASMLFGADFTHQHKFWSHLYYYSTFIVFGTALLFERLEKDQ